MRTFVVGGPYYGSKLDVRTAMTIQQLIGWAPSHGYDCKGMIAEDSMLDLARNMLMHRAIGMGVEWLVSLDADISIKNPRDVFASLAAQRDTSVAVVGWPARCGDGKWNVVVDGHTIRDPLVGPRYVDRVGTGAIAFRLGWYVKNWPKDEPWFHTFTMRHPDGKPYCVGEDYGHCNGVRSLKGKIVCDPNVKVVHHTARIGSPASRIDEELV